MTLFVLCSSLSSLLMEVTFESNSLGMISFTTAREPSSASHTALLAVDFGDELDTGIGMSFVPADGESVFTLEDAGLLFGIM